MDLQLLGGKGFDKMEMGSFQVIKNHYLIFKVNVSFKKNISLGFQKI